MALPDLLGHPNPSSHSTSLFDGWFCAVSGFHKGPSWPSPLPGSYSFLLVTSSNRGVTGLVHTNGGNGWLVTVLPGLSLHFPRAVFSWIGLHLISPQGKETLYGARFRDQKHGLEKHGFQSQIELGPSHACGVKLCNPFEFHYPHLQSEGNVYFRNDAKLLAWYYKKDTLDIINVDIIVGLLYLDLRPVLERDEC